MRRIHSDNNLVISANSLNFLSLNASVAVNELIATMKVSVDYEHHRCAIGSSVSGEFTAMSFSITLPNSFLASSSLQKVETIFGDWKIEGHLGYTIEGTIFTDQNSETQPVNSDTYDINMSNSAILASASAGMSVLLVIGIILL